MHLKNHHILFVCSWYPGKNSPVLGNFIQQHAKAAALTNRISVVYASADKSLESGKFLLEENHNNNLSEYRIYYGKIISSVPVLSKLKKREIYKNAIEQGIDAAIKKNGKIDLLHLQVIWPAAVAVLPLLDKLKVPLIISEHWSGYLPEDGNYKGLIQKNISKRIAEKAKLITIVSDRMSDAMKKHGLGKNFLLLPNAVDSQIFNYWKKENTTTNLKLLHVSMLVDREKNISGLLNVMSALKGHSEISLDIIGDGPEKNKYEDFAQQENILNKSVLFRGIANPAAIAKAMQEADALIMFSNFEGMPVTIIEAQCCGLPIIATKVGFIPNMVDESQGLLVESGNEDALKNTILSFSENRNNYNSKNISDKAIKTYSLEAVGEQLNSIYAAILSEK
ncbi:glycosyltransferase [soil metagenome]